MVGEFPELQGVMGRYYALHGGEDARVAEAIGAHYRPLGPTDDVPREPVAIAVALADKLDQLAAFFAVGERPTGSGDPFALRRAALGVIRIVRENGLRLAAASMLLATAVDEAATSGARGAHRRTRWKSARRRLRRGAAAGSAADSGAHRRRSRFVDVCSTSSPNASASSSAPRARVTTSWPPCSAPRPMTTSCASSPAPTRSRPLVEGPDGPNLLTAYRRAANILRIEDRKDGPHAGEPDPALLRAPEEIALAAAARPRRAGRARAPRRGGLRRRHGRARRAPRAARRLLRSRHGERCGSGTRRNRLRLLAELRDAMDAVADLSKIEG